MVATRIHPHKLSGGHRLGLLTGGEALFAALVQAMDAARSSIHLETYIFDFRGSPLVVAQALERAALRGLSVRLVVDGVGTADMPMAWRARLLAAGVQLRVYAPLGRLGLLLPSRWRRLHRKLCVVDGVLGFCGGINLLDDHIDTATNALHFPRFDFALRCTGPLVEDMNASMLQLWWRLQAVRKARQREFGAAWEALKAGAPVGDFSDWLLPDWLWEHGRRLHERSTPRTPPPMVDNAQAMLVLRDNIWHRADIEKAYLKAIGEARHEVLLANAYFVPGRRLRRALVTAAARGVRVRVLMQGHYEGFMQYHAARPVYKQLIDAGVDVREYTPSAMHAKVAVVDGAWATVGSSNLDPLSLLLAREANVVTTDSRFAQDLRQRLQQAMDHGAVALDHQALLARPWHQRALDRLAFGLMRVLLFLTGHRY
jgi:cardiolipin synthase